jgi:hypothetical protein
MKRRVCSLVLALAMILSFVPAYALAEGAPEPGPQSGASPWDLFDATMADYADDFKAINTAGGGTIDQRGNYININKGNDKSNTASGGAYTWVTPADQKAPVLPKDGPFTMEATIRLAGPVDGARTNEFSARVNGTEKYFPVFLKYGTTDGGITNRADFNEPVPVDTTVWHNYGLVVNPTDSSYKVYVDGVLVLDLISNWGLTGADLVRVGVDNKGRSNMDVQSLRVGTGDLSALLGEYPLPEDTEPRLMSVALSESSQNDNEERTVTATVTGQHFEDGTSVAVRLVDGTGAAVEGVTAAGSFTDNTAEIALTIPAGLSTGLYYVEAQAGGGTVRSAAYTVETSRTAPNFPTFTALGYTIEMDDYKYNPTEEFNFPTIVDTKKHPVTNALGDYRYYLFYAPHDAPAGNCVAASDSLDGPWVEYEGNPVVGKTWPKEDGSGNYYNVSHVSSPHVMWLEEQGCYVMYFHGENTTTRYATSTDLLNWTYGGVCVVANDFSPTNSGFNEASYARVFEHQVPGLDNKYIMLLMITGPGNNTHRNIYWAHSKDGISWTPVKESLLNPDMNSVYKSNFSGPWFMEWGGRYFVICHASSGEMYAFEVGERLDECVEWGEVYNSQGVRGTDDANPECYPDYGRSGAPYFIQDESGRWHMFYEAGKRLNTNIVHAMEVKAGEESQLARAGLELADADSILAVGGTARPALILFDKSNRQVVADGEGLSFTYHASDPQVLKYENGLLTALGKGTATAWVEITRDGVKAVSQKVEVTVKEKSTPAEGIILTNEGLTGKTANNLELPAIFKAAGRISDPIDNYYLYFSYNNNGSGRSIALATAPAPEGPWTAYNSGTPVITTASLGLGGTAGTNAPWPMWDAQNNLMMLYYSQGNNNMGMATSPDGVTFTNAQTVLRGEDAPVGTEAYQQSVYEYTIPSKDNKYLMLYTGNGYTAEGVTNGKQLFYAWSKDGVAWETAKEPLLSPGSGDSNNIASPRLLVRDGVPYLVYHNSTGDLEYAQLSADLATVTRKGVFYDSLADEPDNGRAADAVFLQEGSGLYLYYTARSNKGTTPEAASVIVCRKLAGGGEVLFSDDFSDGNADGWVSDGGTWTVADGAYFQSNKSGSAMAFAGDMAWTDYEVEVKVTPVETSKNVAVMLSGRADGAANRYIGAYNEGKLTINRRIDGNDSVLAEGSYTMSVGKTYTMKLVFQGNNITLYVHGDEKDETLSVTDNTYASGKIGLAAYNTSAKFDDVVVRALSNEPTVPIKVTDFGDHQVIQRDPDTERADVAVSGTAFAAAAKVEVRVLNFETGADVVGWTAVAQNVAEGSPWSGSLSVPQGGWYKLEARALDGDGKVLGSAVGSRKWGVGINVLCIGQSNMVGQASDLPRTVANDLVANYTRAGNWTHLVDPYDGAGGSLVPAMGNYLVEMLGIPVGFVPAADSGSGLHAPNPYTNPPHGPTRYWMYYTTPSDTSTLYGKAVTRAKAAGGVELAVWNQGETDGSILVAKEIYESDMKTLLSRLRTDLDNETLPIFLCQIGTHDNNISNDAAYTAIRSAQHDLDDGVNFFLAATEMEFARKDTAHYTQPGLNEIGRRVANSVLYHFGKVNSYRGPYISSADYADADRKVIDVKITHRGGDDISTTGEITGFSVLDGVKEAVITSAVRQGPDTVRLTLTAPIAGSGRVRYLYGLNPPHSNIVKDNNPYMALPLENTTTDIPVGGDESVAWDLMDHDMGPDWLADGWRQSTKQGNGTYTQESDYVNINKPNGTAIGTAGLYHWAVSPATLALPRDGFTLRVTARTAGAVDAQANEIGIRMGLDANDLDGKLASIFLGYGEEGFVSASATGTGRFTMKLDTTVWHDYTIAARLENEAYVFDLYVDDALAFESVPFVIYKGGDLIRLGCDIGGRCDLDVKNVRLGSGEVLPEGVSPARVTGVSLSAQSQKETETKAVTVTVTGRDFADGERVDLSLVNRNYIDVPGVTAQAVFTGNTATAVLTIPAGLSVTDYYVKARANGRVRYSAAYTVEVQRSAPSFPQFTPDGFTIEMDDYQYNPTKEFNFPTIVDTKDHPVTNELGNYRYYLFYAPHDAPAGNCVAASNSLDGPWVEYEGNPVVGKTWPKEDGSGENWYEVSHVSSPHVIWNEVYQCYFMYFHGENNVTRYATSTDLLNWTYGGVCVVANDFSATGSGHTEASYARVFEHEVPGLGNRYIMLLMINNSADMRKIFWAHSVDGKDWTAVQTPLLDPSMSSEYKGNFSGPWFMERDGRYFVVCHASSGNMYAFEVGESLDECIPWGVFYDSRDSVDPNNVEHESAWPDYGRAGAPSFVKDDEGRWHMFYEGGKRLHANIVHATAPADYVPPVYENTGGNTTTKTETLPDGTKVTTRIDLATGTVTVTKLTPDGSKTVAVTKKDGSGTETLTRADGVRADSKIAADGSVTTAVTVPETMGRTVVDIPAGKGNVAVLIGEDGKEQVLTLFILKDGRLKVLLDASAEIRVVARGAAFSDTAGTAAHEAAAQLAARDVFLGTGPDTFSPDIAVNRAMLVTLLYRLDGRPETAPVDFRDVPADAWFAAGAGWAQARGVTLGVGGGSFAPDAALTWEQLAVMLYRYAGAATQEPDGKSETELALDWCAGAGVGLGLDNNAPVSRGELAAMLYDYIKALVG